MGGVKIAPISSDIETPALSSEGESDRQGQVQADISNAMVRLYKTHFGKGPTRVRSHYHDDVITCVLRDGFTRADMTLIEAGEGERVTSQRHALQLAVRDRFTSEIERITGREVIGFFSGSQEDPPMEVEVFVLASDRQDA